MPIFTCEYTLVISGVFEIEAANQEEATQNSGDEFWNNTEHFEVEEELSWIIQEQE